MKADEALLLMLGMIFAVSFIIRLFFGVELDKQIDWLFYGIF